MYCYDPQKVSSDGSYHADSGSSFTSQGNPSIPTSSSDETAIGCWELTTGDPKQAGMMVDALIDLDAHGPGNPYHGQLSPATVFAGDARCLVTSRALRFTGYAGAIRNFGKAGRTAVLAFSVPLAAITAVDPGRSSAFTTGKWLRIELADVGTVVSVMKAAKANEKFRAGVFATAKNKEFAAQIDAARRSLR
jgi:hypothetical protein